MPPQRSPREPLSLALHLAALNSRYRKRRPEARTTYSCASGGRQEIQIETRVIAATNTDLKQAVAEERFREDLYFRLVTVVITLPL